MAARLDFDSQNGQALVLAALELAKEHQDPRINQWQRNNNLYYGYLDMVNRDPNWAHIHIPKCFNIVETLVPRYIKAAHSARPYLPFEPKRKQVREVGTLQSDLLDNLLDDANFMYYRILATKIAVAHGTAFVEALPYYEPVQETILMPDGLGGAQPTVVAGERLRFQLRTYAPWEVYVDPYATGLHKGALCRYVIKMQLASRRDIVKMAEAKAYPGLDIQKLYATPSTASTELAQHEGLSILEDMGLVRPGNDDDVGVLIRYESPERYIDLWNDTLVLRDVPNQFQHGGVNLSKMTYCLGPHTQDCFWGLGVIKPNEILQAAMNDFWSMTLNNHMMMHEGVFYYRDGAVDPEMLQRVPGARIPVTIKNDQPLRDIIYESYGQSLPVDHYRIMSETERQMDFTSGVYDMQRGEAPVKQTTLGEATMRLESGDIRLEMGLREDELFLSDLGRKCLCHMKQFMRREDVYDVLSPEQAAQLFAYSPMDLPGGFRWKFKGADMVTNDIIRQNVMLKLSDVVRGIPNVLPGWWARQLMEAFHLDDMELDEGIVPDEVMMRFQAIKAQGEARMAAEAKAQLSGQSPMSENSLPPNVTPVPGAAQQFENAGQEVAGSVAG